jgi:hypothetical protein
MALCSLSTGISWAPEMAEFGLILALAPTTLCDEVLRYGESVAYWLGF